MGENDTAAFDPIFYFHHCFIDLMFWRWQVKHNQRDSLEIIQGYPGTNSIDSQGPTPGVAGGTWLTLDSPLDPFKNPNDPTKAITSKELVNIANLGYVYEYAQSPGVIPPITQPAPILTVGNINRATLRGSFVISAWAYLENKEKFLVGAEAILSRWHVAGCQNCQSHLEVRAHIPMEGWTKEETERMRFEVVLHTRTLSKGHPDEVGLQPGHGPQNPTINLRTDHLVMPPLL
jgi:tyrosinase